MTESTLSFVPMVNKLVRRLPGNNSFLSSKRFKVTLLKSSASLKNLSYDIHSL